MSINVNCSETALKLLWNCSEFSNDWNRSISMELLRYCSETALKLLWIFKWWNCSDIALKLLWNCPEIALKLLWNCFETALNFQMMKLLRYCTEIALKSVFNCSETALKLLWIFKWWKFRSIAELSAHPSAKFQHRTLIRLDSIDKSNESTQLPNKSTGNHWLAGVLSMKSAANWSMTSAERRSVRSVRSVRSTWEVEVDPFTFQPNWRVIAPYNWPLLHLLQLTLSSSWVNVY